MERGDTLTGSEVARLSFADVLLIMPCRERDYEFEAQASGTLAHVMVYTERRRLPVIVISAEGQVA